MAKHFSIHEAKAKFSEVIRLVAKRTQVVITHHGNPIAQILPIEQETESLAERIAALTAEGRISSPPVSSASKKRAKLSAVAKRSGALQRFLEDRD